MSCVEVLEDLEDLENDVERRRLLEVDVKRWSLGIGDAWSSIEIVAAPVCEKHFYSYSHSRIPVRIFVFVFIFALFCQPQYIRIRNHPFF